MDESPTPAAWWPIADVAPSIGLSRSVMLAAIDRGELPIRRQTFGPRGMVFVLGVDVCNYLRSLLPTETAT